MLSTEEHSNIITAIKFQFVKFTYRDHQNTEGTLPFTDHSGFTAGNSARAAVSLERIFFNSIRFFKVFGLVKVLTGIGFHLP